MDVQREQGVKPGVRMGWGRQADLSAAPARCSAAFPPNTEVPHAHAHLARHPERHRTPVRQGPSHTHPPYRPTPATIPDEPHSTPHLTTISNQPLLGKSAPAIARRCLKVGLQTQSPERGAWVATRPQTHPPPPPPPPRPTGPPLPCSPTNPTEAALFTAWQGWIKHVL